jgi:hypothetical protein
LEKYPDKINWICLSQNPNATTTRLLEQNQDKIEWNIVSENPCIFEIDYLTMAKRRCSIYIEELMQVALHPSKIQKLFDMEIRCEDLDLYM